MHKPWFKKIIHGWLIGVIILMPLHWLQIHFQIADYSNPTFLKIAWWAPLVYGTLFLLMMLIFPVLEDFLTATFTFQRKTITIELLALLFAFIVPIATQDYPYFSVLILAIYVLARLGFFHAKWDWLFFIIGALIGPTVQILLISEDLYHYNNPDFVGIPYWLPVHCGIVAMAGRRFSHLVGK